VTLGIEERFALDDRLIASFAARHFHIELHSVLLQGGGHIEGRVHRDGDWPAGGLTVSARCLEAWRVARQPPPLVVRARGGPPHRWREETLWDEAIELEGLDDANWRGFRFALPDDLPPAVEARSVAWRYEVEASRPGRLYHVERAVTTPLRYRALLIRPLS
jgi:hypothetical protein